MAHVLTGDIKGDVTAGPTAATVPQRTEQTPATGTDRGDR